MYCDGDEESPYFEKFSFLPRDIIEEKITTEAINAKFSWTSNLFYRSRVERIAKEAKRVVCILLLIQEEDLLWSFFEEGLTDQHLPLRAPGNGKGALVSQNGQEFHSFARQPRSTSRASQFLKTQWQVLAPVITKPGDHIDIEKLAPPPFYDIKEITSNGRSTVYRGKLHPAHITPSPEKAVPIAIKDYRNGKDFEIEKSVLEKINGFNHPHLIKHIATFQQARHTYAAFPWAEGGNLSDLWEHNPDIATSRKLETFVWAFKQMHGLVGALHALHQINCRHGDLKPENILNFTDSAQGPYGFGTLKVADVGVSKVHHQATVLRHDPTNTKATTPSYEAPEVVFNEGKPRSRRYDMWSIGCMFMEFAIWLLHGYPAVEGFRIRRQSANGFDTKATYWQATKEKDKPKVHEDVRRGLRALKDDPRCAPGTGLATLILIIEHDLILIEEESRAQSHDLKDKFDYIMREKGPPFLYKSVEPVPSIPDVFCPVG
ncbi:kinase-like protein [Poronia punctata]|nr:kinase-like protein [Poronia punctata]